MHQQDIVPQKHSLVGMKTLGALVFTFVCAMQCTWGEKPPKDNSKGVIRGITAVCYDPKDVCYFHPCQNGGSCSPPKANGDDKPYTCHCFLGFGGVSCEKRQGKSVSWITYYTRSHWERVECCRKILGSTKLFCLHVLIRTAGENICRQRHKTCNSYHLIPLMPESVYVYCKLRWARTEYHFEKYSNTWNPNRNAGTIYPDTCKFTAPMMSRKAYKRQTKR